MAVAWPLAGNMHVCVRDAAMLFVFGALNLAQGMILFVTDLRLLPAAVATVIGTAEPVLGPVWWIEHVDAVAG